MHKLLVVSRTPHVHSLTKKNKGEHQANIKRTPSEYKPELAPGRGYGGALAIFLFTRARAREL
jgi:hypothetical protein